LNIIVPAVLEVLNFKYYNDGVLISPYYIK